MAKLSDKDTKSSSVLSTYHEILSVDGSCRLRYNERKERRKAGTRLQKRVDMRGGTWSGNLSEKQTETDLR